MTNKKGELQEENLENVNGGFLLAFVGGLIIKKLLTTAEKIMCPRPQLLPRQQPIKTLAAMRLKASKILTPANLPTMTTALLAADSKGL